MCPYLVDDGVSSNLKNESAIPSVISATRTTTLNTCLSPLYVPFKPLVCGVLILGFTRYSSLHVVLDLHPSHVLQKTGINET
jgi:hypothetical protein